MHPHASSTSPDLARALAHSVPFEVAPPLPAGPAAAPGVTTDAVAAFVAENAAMLERRALWMTGDRAEALDLVQDVLVRALTAGNKIPRQKLRGWVLVIMHNLCVDRRRAKRRRRQHALTDHAIDCASMAGASAELAAGPVWRSFDEDDLEAALGQLPAPLRCAFELGASGQPYTEIAATLKVAPATVSTRIFRARRMLRKFLQAKAQEVETRPVASAGRSRSRGRRPAATVTTTTLAASVA